MVVGSVLFAVGSLSQCYQIHLSTLSNFFKKMWRLDDDTLRAVVYVTVQKKQSCRIRRCSEPLWVAL